MIKLEIISKTGYEYVLKDDENNKYILNLDFLDIEKIPDEEDYIYINEELLNSKYEGYSKSYTFGSMESKYGRAKLSKDDVDVIKLTIREKEIYLKRLYG